MVCLVNAVPGNTAKVVHFARHYEENAATLTCLVCIFAWHSSSLLANLVLSDMGRDSVAFEPTPGTSDWLSKFICN